MTIKLNREMIKNIIKQYYQRFYNMEINVTIKATKDCVGYYEEEGCLIEILAKGQMSLAGNTYPFEETITKEKLEEICKEMLALEEMEVRYISYDSGLTTSTEGYGLGEHTVKKAYFSGIDVDVMPMNQSRNLMKITH
mgnify:CR=1 FL=1